MHEPQFCIYTSNSLVRPEHNRRRFVDVFVKIHLHGECFVLIQLPLTFALNGQLTLC